MEAKEEEVIDWTVEELGMFVEENFDKDTAAMMIGELP